MHILQPQLVRL